MARMSLLAAFLGGVIVLAALLAAGWSVWWIAPLIWLGQFQTFHIVAHFGIFAGVTFLARPWEHAWWMWLVPIGGGVLVEIVQIGMGGFGLSKPLMVDVVFDLVVDMMGIVVCTTLLLALNLRPQWTMTDRV